MNRRPPYLFISCLLLSSVLCAAYPDSTSEYRATITSCEEVKALADRVSIVRGLSLSTPVSCQALSERQFQARINKVYEAANGKQRTIYEGELFKLLGLVPLEYDYAGCLTHGIADEVNAFYDYTLSRSIVIPESRPVSRHTLVHEIAHALQDRHFNLNQLHHRLCTRTDSCLALAALTEGDSQVTREVYENKFGPPPAEQRQEKASEGTAADSCSLPRILEAQLDFPYSFGPIFVERLIDKGGTEAVDRAYYSPPGSTSQILLPGRYNSDWRPELPTLPRQIDGNSGELVYEDTIGQYSTSLLLRESSGESQAILAAKGWEGDAAGLYRYRDRNSYGVLWVTLWKTEEDAEEFSLALKKSLARRFSAYFQAGARLFHYEDPAKGAFQFEREGKKVTLFVRQK